VSFDVVTMVNEMHIFACDSFDDIFGGSSQKFSDDGELVNIYGKSEKGVRLEWAPNVRSLPGNNGFPSNISAKIQPALQMSTATSYFCQVSMISGAR
jgi:hypothetical protein